MKIFILVTLLYYSRRCHGENSSNQSAILQGTPTFISVHPSTAFIVKSNSILSGDNCGASILTIDYVLTAGSCLVGPIGTITIIVGTTRITKGGTHYTSSKFIVHENHFGHGTDYNVGLAKTDTTIKWGDNVKPARLANANNVLRTNQMLTVLGWGWLQADTTNNNPSLMAVTLPVIEYSKCKETYKKNGIDLTERSFCAGYLAGGKSVCTVDTGGPALDANHLQVGIVSYVINCGDKSYPPIFTNIAPVREWIRLKTKV